MSLLNRLWASVILAMLLALAASLVLSVLTARNYLAQQLYAHSNDSAASLALSMSQRGGDPAMRELMVSALFDSGHFDHVIFRTPTGEIEVERRNTAMKAEAPAWFVSLVPLKAAPGQALVSDGWKQAGSVEVLSSPRFAYGALWRGAVQMSLVLALIGAMLGMSVTLIMRWAWRPLADLIRQAESIGRRHFVAAPEPRVKEMRVVVTAMNAMVERVQAMFSEQAARLDALRAEAYRDSLTGLPNRTLFMGRLREALDDNESAPLNTLVVCRLADLAGVNRRLGRERADALLKACAAVVENWARDHAEAECARLNGAEFAVMLPGIGKDVAEAAAQALASGLDNLYRHEYTDQRPVAAVCWTVFSAGEAVSEVLVRADNALMRAEAHGMVAGSQTGVEAPAISPADWRGRLDEALQRKGFELTAYPVVRCEGSLLHNEVMLRMITPSGERMSAGMFMPAASRYGRIADVDRVAVELAVARLYVEPGDIAVNLSPLSLEQPGFLAALEAALQQAGGGAARLWFELSERGLAEDSSFKSLRALAELLARHGCKLGIEHFGRHFAAIPRLHAVPLDYLKLDGGFVADIDQHSGNQRFVKSVVDVARSLQIDVIAGQVATAAEWQTLQALGVSGVTGPAVTAGKAG